MSQPNDPLTTRYHAASVEKIREIRDQLEAVSDQDMPKLPEHLFKKIFLDFFAGDPAYNDPAARKMRLVEWLSITGNPFQEVAIIDDHDRLHVLFRVPPLFDRSVVKSVVKNRTSLGHILRSAEQYSQISPIAGRNYLFQHMNGFDLLEGEAEHRSQYLDRWNKILTRYGKQKLKQGLPVAGAAADQGDDDGEPEFTF